MNNISLILYLMTILSGASALMYEIVWFRSLSLIFGGTHLAIATTVSVFMLGLALGNWVAGKHLDKFKNLLPVYGCLEVGIAIGAGLFLAFLSIYPSIYIPLANVAPESPTYLTIIRVCFAATAMITPTIFMGATLPVLTKTLTTSTQSLARHLSLLYGFNTLGAVMGVVVTAFYLLNIMEVSSVSYLAMAFNCFIGLTCFLLKPEITEQTEVETAEPARTSRPEKRRKKKKEQSGTKELPIPSLSSYRLVLWGIGISGFCALGYEILWTRILIIFFDASVYSFSIVLVAFLLGISLGGLSYRGWRSLFRVRSTEERAHPLSDISHFGLTQIFIGLSSLITINIIYDLPSYLISAGRFFYGATGIVFSARQYGNFSVAFLLMFFPSLLMGLAIPLAGRINSRFRDRVGKATGEILAFNTVGSILGAALSGFILIQLLGIQRSLQFFAVVNISLGCIVIISNKGIKPRIGLLAKATIASLVLLILVSGGLEKWDNRYLAAYTPNNAPNYIDKESINESLDGKDVIYYGEGSESIVSSVRTKQDGLISFHVNGRIEASTQLEDVQLQYILGHLPMLLHGAPKSALVIGGGSGMTLGAVSVYPELEEVKLAEIEPKVLGVLKTFSAWNHNVLDNLKLDIVLNDGRNFLLTTQEKFDVITTDPIHPSWRGSGYLYTTEYFRQVADHLKPGGIVSQWLPLYQLSVENQQSIVKTFHENFKHTTVWLGLTDMILIGSNTPILYDEAQLATRLAEESIAGDFKLLSINSPEDLFSYFFMGTSGVEAFSEQARVNSDNNLYLEFSTPRHIGNNNLEAKNVEYMANYRESIVPYLKPLKNETAQEKRKLFWQTYFKQAENLDTAQVIYLKNTQPGVKPEELSIKVKEAVYHPGNLSRGKNLKLVLFGLN